MEPVLPSGGEMADVDFDGVSRRRSLQNEALAVARPYNESHESSSEISDATSLSGASSSNIVVGVQVAALDALPLEITRYNYFSFAALKCILKCDSERQKDCKDLCKALSYFLLILFPLIFSFLIVEHAPGVYEKHYTECKDLRPRNNFVGVSKYTFSVENQVENRRSLYNEQNHVLYSFQYTGSNTYTFDDIICGKGENGNVSKGYCVEPIDEFGHENIAKVKIYPIDSPSISITAEISYARSNLPYDYIQIVTTIGKFEYLFIANGKNSNTFSRANYDDYGQLIEEYVDTDSDGVFGEPDGRLPWIGAVSESGEFICTPSGDTTTSGLDDHAKLTLYDVESTLKLNTLSVSEAETILNDILRGDVLARIHFLTIGLVNTRFIFSKLAVVVGLYLLIGLLVQSFLVWRKRENRNANRYNETANQHYISSDITL